MFEYMEIFEDVEIVIEGQSVGILDKVAVWFTEDPSSADDYSIDRFLIAGSDLRADEITDQTPGIWNHEAFRECVEDWAYSNIDETEYYDRLKQFYRDLKDGEREGRR